MVRSRSAGLLAGHVCVVTGGASGMGAACVQLFAEESAKAVAILDMQPPTESVVSEARKSGCDILTFMLDVTDRDAIDRAIDCVWMSYGAVDSAANCAGITGTKAVLSSYPVDDWQRVLDVNLTGVFHCMQAELRVMLRQGRGAVVNVSSAASVHPPPELGAYAASKSALVGLGRSAAGDYAGRNIRINTVLPGLVETPMLMSSGNREDEAASDAMARLSRSSPMGRVGRPVEVANAIAWLLSDNASYVHGVDLLVDGGAHAFSPAVVAR